MHLQYGLVRCHAGGVGVWCAKHRYGSGTTCPCCIFTHDEVRVACQSWGTLCRQSLLVERPHLPHRQSSLNGPPVCDFWLSASRKENMMHSSTYSKSSTSTTQICTQNHPSSWHLSSLVTGSSYPSSPCHRQCHERQAVPFWQHAEHNFQSDFCEERQHLSIWVTSHPKL